VEAALPAALIVGGTMFAASSDGIGESNQALGSDYTKTCSTDMSSDPCISQFPLPGVDRVRCGIKQRLFCANSPTEVLSLLDALDSRSKEIKMRSDGTETCFKQAAVDHTSDLSFPGNATFTHYLQCKDSSIPLGFGKKDGSWYVRSSGPPGGWVFSIDANDDVVAGYLWGINAAGSGKSMLELSASKTAGRVEFVGGGVGTGFCAIHFVSSAAYAWILINPEGVGSSCDSDSNGTTDANDYTELCIDATTLDPALPPNCASLKSAATLTLMGRAAGIGDGHTVEGAAQPPAGTNINLIDLGSLKGLTDSAGAMTGVSEFKPPL
jgi:hypothetical protein